MHPSIIAEVEHRLTAALPGLGYALAPTRDGLLLKIHAPERIIAVLLLPHICSVASALAPIQSIQIGTDPPVSARAIQFWAQE